MTPRSLAACALALLITLVPVVSTAGPVLDFTGGALELCNFKGCPLAEILTAEGLTVGWAFTVGSPIVVDALGLFDVGGDGLQDPHTIGLWTAAGGSPIATAVVVNANSSPAPSASSFGQWLFTSITPVILAAGEYVIGATYFVFNATNSTSFGTDGFALNASAFTVPGVTFVEPRFAIGFDFPANASLASTDGFFGPNLSVVNAVVEPASLVLLGTGLAGLTGLAAWRTRRRR